MAFISFFHREFSSFLNCHHYLASKAEFCAANSKLMLIVENDVANEVNAVKWNLCCLTKLVLVEEVNAACLT